MLVQRLCWTSPRGYELKSVTLGCTRGMVSPHGLLSEVEILAANYCLYFGHLQGLRGCLVRFACTLLAFVHAFACHGSNGVKQKLDSAGHGIYDSALLLVQAIIKISEQAQAGAAAAAGLQEMQEYWSTRSFDGLIDGDGYEGMHVARCCSGRACRQASITTAVTCMHSKRSQRESV